LNTMVKDILQGVVITSLIITLTVFLPVFGLFCTVLIPLPVLYFRAKLGRVFGAVVAVLSLAVTTAVIGSFSLDSLFLVELLIIGFLLGELIEMNVSIERTLVATCSGVVLTSLIGLLIFSHLSNQGLYDLVSSYIRKNLELSLALYRDMGVSEAGIQMIADSLDRIQDVLVGITPALVVVSTLITAWIVLLLARPLFRKKGMFYPNHGNLNRWKAPEHLVWAVIGFAVMLLIPDSLPRIVGLNGLMILLTVYFFQGMAIVSFFFEKKHLPRLLRVFLYSLIFIQQIVLLVVIGLGFFDMWVNFRKLEVQP
jgi:uncharacterized protein YybS (DUF2232 family)